MMNNQTLTYKGYIASVAYSPQDNYYTGDVIGIKHRIVFHGSTLDEAINKFHDLIDDYPEMCKEFGIELEQPPTEVLVPFPPELYAQAYGKAETTGVPVQQLMQEALQQSLA